MKLNNCRTVVVAINILLIMLFSNCARKESEEEKTGREKKSEYLFALIAKNQSNPVFQSARVGMEDGARDVGQKLGVTLQAVWRTPNEEDAQLQANYIEQLVLQGVDGISISCSIADVITPAINRAVEQGIPVMCFDSDAPVSKRFCYFGTDDRECGRTVMHALVQELGPGEHIVALPGGSQNAVNIQNRIKGALEEASKFKHITIKGVYYHKETPQDAAAKVEEVQTANPDINGWAMVGAWSLFTDALMRWEPGKVKMVSVDALPPQLPYLKKGIVSKLFAQDTYGWGYRSIAILADKVILGKDPAKAIEFAPLIPVTIENVDEFEKNWEKWLHQ